MILYPLLSIFTLCDCGGDCESGGCCDYCRINDLYTKKIYSKLLPVCNKKKRDFTFPYKIIDVVSFEPSFTLRYI